MEKETGSASMPSRANRRTAFALLGVALVFFFGIMLKYWLQRHS